MTRGPLPARRDFVARYRAGEHAVWGELVGHAAAITLHAELRAEAEAVAHELMTRVRAVIGGGAGQDAAALADVVGVLPLSLAALWRVCGAIDHAGLRIAAPAAFRDDIAAYARRCAESHREIVGPLALPIVQCGGATHAIELPTTPLADAVDPVVRGTGTRLVPYLRGMLGASF